MIAIADVDRRGRGVADTLALDTRAEGLGEFGRARHVDIPEELLR